MPTASLERHVEADGEASLPTPSQEDLAPLTRTPLPLHVLAIGTYLALSLVLWGHVWFGGNPAHSITCNCGDTAQQVWWFEWLPWAAEPRPQSPAHQRPLGPLWWGERPLQHQLARSRGGALADHPAVRSRRLLQRGQPRCSRALRLGRLRARRPDLRPNRRPPRRRGLYAFSPFVLRNTVLGHVGLDHDGVPAPGAAPRPATACRGARPGAHRPLSGRADGPPVLHRSRGAGPHGRHGNPLRRRGGDLPAQGRGVGPPGTCSSLARPAPSLVGVLLAYPLWLYLAGPRHVVGPYWPVSRPQPWGSSPPGPTSSIAHRPDPRGLSRAAGPGHRLPRSRAPARRRRVVPAVAPSPLVHDPGRGRHRVVGPRIRPRTGSGRGSRSPPASSRSASPSRSPSAWASSSPPPSTVGGAPRSGDGMPPGDPS